MFISPSKKFEFLTIFSWVAFFKIKKSDESGLVKRIQLKIKKIKEKMQPFHPIQLKELHLNFQ